VGREALGPRAPTTALEAARAVALFDQRGCVSPHVFLVEEGGEVSPGEWATLLAGTMAKVEEELPFGVLSQEEGVGLQQFRGVGEMEEALGGGAIIFHGGANAPWTVFFHPGGELKPSCLGRTVTVLPLADLNLAPKALEDWAGHLQTVGLAGSGDRIGSLVESLARMGVTRVAPLGGVPWPPPWWHHDGSGPLRALTRWTDWEDLGGGSTPGTVGEWRLDPE
jgi:hypothetical protein